MSRGNIVDLAVAVVIGTAFAALVAALVDGILMPLVGAIIGEPDFSGISFTLNGSSIEIGLVINALITFISIAAAIYFFVVLPMEKVAGMRKRGEDAEPLVKECPECLSEIPAKARRCAHCTSVVE